MTVQAETTKPAPARRGLFKRPKWAASNTAKPNDSATTTKNEDFFSRSNETFAAFAKEEEEREKRRLSKRAAKQQVKSPPPTNDSQKPSPKRRRLSAESDSDDDGGEHLSDIEAERAEEEAARARAEADVEAAATKKELTDLLDKGKAFVKDGMAQLGMEEETAPPPSPSKLPSDAPRIPNDEQCDSIRAKQPR